MSKKTVIILSIILFMILIALIVCERCYPEAGTQLIENLVTK